MRTYFSGTKIIKLLLYFSHLISFRKLTLITIWKESVIVVTILNETIVDVLDESGKLKSKK